MRCCCVTRNSYICIYIIMTTEIAAIAEVCFALRARRAARRISRAYDRALAPKGIDVSQFNILTVIGARAPVSLGDVANALALDPSTLSRTLQPLRLNGLVDVTGRRGRGGLTLSLSDRGWDVLVEASQVWRAVQAKIAAALGESRVGPAIEVLERIDAAAGVP
ncbi:MAG: MarR family winged helix-turn-helix transcriptional regulator [Rhodospirillaceae bacterium]|nr:MarR family winged helix-turn-helix transcriptional regulator [Rhodospirillaceae bacterium]